MRSLTPSERRTVRLGAIGLGIYLAVFFGFQSWKSLNRQRTEYDRLHSEAVTWKNRLEVSREKAQLARDLMEQVRFDPVQLSRTSVVAQASAAIQQAALGGGLQLGPIRESSGRSSARELAAMQLEGVGPPTGVLRFLHDLGNLGFPLIAESVLFTPEPRQPGRLKLNVTIVILDFERWDPPQENRPDA